MSNGDAGSAVHRAYGYHGTTRKWWNEITTNRELKFSSRGGKWLGPGAYFFHDGPHHAAAWAKQRYPVEDRVVIRAEINLDSCLDLVDGQNWPHIRDLLTDRSRAGANGPQNPHGCEALLLADASDPNHALYKHIGDHDLIDSFCQHEADQNQRAFSSIRACFIEGLPVAPNSWLYDQSHICICVRAPKALGQIGLFDMETSDVSETVRIVRVLETVRAQAAP